MQMNKSYSQKAAEKITEARESITRLEEQIAALETAAQMVEAYSANMTCSYEYEETN